MPEITYYSRLYSDFWELDTLPEDPTAANVILSCKRNFSKNGIPVVVVTDTAWQFDCKVWAICKRMAHQFHTITSQTKKFNQQWTQLRSLSKKQQDICELWKAILNWRNSPTKKAGSSPTQRLMSRITKNQLPRANALLNETSCGCKENANNEALMIIKVLQQNSIWAISSERWCSKGEAKSWGQDFKMALRSNYQ